MKKMTMKTKNDIVCRDFAVVSKYENEDIITPVRSTGLSAGYDIFNNGESFVIPAHGVSSAISTKLKAYMQPDEVLCIFVRSSMGFKKGVTLVQNVAIIDADYVDNENNEGEIFLKFRNNSDEDVTIEKGSAFAQGMFQKYLLVDGDYYGNGSVRKGGVGSTDKTEKTKVEYQKHPIDEK